MSVAEAPIHEWKTFCHHHHTAIPRQVQHTTHAVLCMCVSTHCVHTTQLFFCLFHIEPKERESEKREKERQSQIAKDRATRTHTRATTRMHAFRFMQIRLIISWGKGGNEYAVIHRYVCVHITWYTQCVSSPFSDLCEYGLDIYIICHTKKYLIVHTPTNTYAR